MKVKTSKSLAKKGTEPEYGQSFKAIINEGLIRNMTNVMLELELKLKARAVV